MSNDVRNLTMGELNHIFGGVESCEMPGGSSLESGRFRRQSLNDGTGGFSAGHSVFAGASFMMIGAAAAATLPFLGAGFVAATGIAVSAAILGAAGAVLVDIGLTGMSW